MELIKILIDLIKDNVIETTLSVFITILVALWLSGLELGGVIVLFMVSLFLVFTFSVIIKYFVKKKEQ